MYLLYVISFLLVLPQNVLKRNTTRESEIPSKKLRICPLPPLKFSCVHLELIVTWIAELILLVNTGVPCITRSLRSCYS